MPTKVILSCSNCGIVEGYNYEYPEKQPGEQFCPICGKTATFISAELVPVAGVSRIVEPIVEPIPDEEKEEVYGKKVRKARRKE